MNVWWAHSRAAPLLHPTLHPNMADVPCNDCKHAVVCTHSLYDLQSVPSNTKLLQHWLQNSTRHKITCLSEGNRTACQFAFGLTCCCLSTNDLKISSDITLQPLVVQHYRASTHAHISKMSLSGCLEHVDPSKIELLIACPVEYLHPDDCSRVTSLKASIQNAQKYQGAHSFTCRFASVALQ